VDALAEPNFNDYMSELQRRIRRNWRPPDDQEDKTVVYIFTIAKDGRLLSKSIKRSSGSPQADAAALAAIEMSAPFRPLPPEFRGGSINIEFRFDYNVFQGGNGAYRR
jgi:TonB family protein